MRNTQLEIPIELSIKTGNNTCCLNYDTNNKMGYCKYCMKDLCVNCGIKWVKDIYGNNINPEQSDGKDYLVVCLYCTLEAEEVVNNIKFIRDKANDIIREVVNRYQFKMTEDRKDRNL